MTEFYRNQLKIYSAPLIKESLHNKVEVDKEKRTF